MRIEDRQYQIDDTNYAMGHGIDHKVIHCAPTGSGKTIIQAQMCKRELDRGDSTAILTPRNEIFDQTHRIVSELCGHGNVSVLRAKRQGESWHPVNPVHIVSWPTLIARARKSDFWFPRVNRVLVDECHLSVAPKILEILEHYAPKARIDGYTATPARQTGRGLGHFFTEIKHVTSVRQLIKDGWLCPVEYYAGSQVDLTGIKIKRGDYEVGKLSQASRTKELIGDAIDNWLRLASNRHTIVFTVDIAHCEAIAERYQQAGIKAAALHTGMDQIERDAIVTAFKSQGLQVLVNVSIASYGFDAPSVNCIQILRDTKSIVLHLQMIGRGMRPAIGQDGLPIKDPGHPDFKVCTVLDHTNNVRSLGMADDLFRWRLDEGKKACENWTRDEKSGEAEEAKQHTCEDCKYIFAGSRVCPKCGWKVPFRKKDVAATDADLVPIGKNLVKRLPKDWVSHEVFFQMLIHHAKKKGWKAGWVFNTFRKKAGASAPGYWINMAGIPPDKRVANYIISRQIAYAARQKAERQRTAGVSG